jgi:hypothetical protein
MKSIILITLIVVIVIFLAGLTYSLIIPKDDPRSISYALMKRGIIRPNCALLEKALLLDKNRDDWVKGRTVENIKERLPCIKNYKEFSETAQEYFGPPAKHGVDDLYILNVSNLANYGWVIMIKDNKGVGIRLFKG